MVISPAWPLPLRNDLVNSNMTDENSDLRQPSGLECGHKLQPHLDPSPYGVWIRLSHRNADSGFEMDEVGRESYQQLFTALRQGSKYRQELSHVT